MEIRQRMVYDEFGGIGTNDMKGGIHAARAENVRLDNGVTKRHGWVEVSRCPDGVLSMTEVVLGNAMVRLAYLRNKQFVLQRLTDRDDIHELPWETVPMEVEVAELEARAVQFYGQDGKVFIVGAGEYLVLQTEGENAIIKRVYGNEDTYVPTTWIGGLPMGEVSYEKVNYPTTGDYYVYANGWRRVVFANGEPVQVEIRNGEDPGTENEINESDVTALLGENPTYYRKVPMKSGAPYEEANLLTPYRRNGFVGYREPRDYKLDADMVDVGPCTLEIRVREGERTHTISMTSAGDGNEWRAPRAGDELSGKVLRITGGSFRAASLRLWGATTGFVLLRTPGLVLRWEAMDAQISSWNTPSLVLRMGNVRHTIATATRNSVWEPYTVCMESKDIVLPMGLGRVEKCFDGGEMAYIHAELPALMSYFDDWGMRWASLDRVNGVLHMLRGAESEDMEDNILLTFPAGTDGHLLVRKGAVSTLYGMDNPDRLFVGGAENGKDVYSKRGHWDYFGQSGICSLGAEGKVTGYLAMPNRDLATFVQEFMRSMLYMRVGVRLTVDRGDDGLSFTPEAEAYRVLGRYPAEPMLHGGLMVGGEYIYIGEGVFRVKVGSSYNDKWVELMSSHVQLAPIGGGAEQDGLLYVPAENGLWVADTRRVCHPSGGVGYEWVMDTTPPLSGVSKVGERVLVCLANGGILAYSDGYKDVLNENGIIQETPVVAVYQGTPQAYRSCDRKLLTRVEVLMEGIEGCALDVKTSHLARYNAFSTDEIWSHILVKPTAGRWVPIRAINRWFHYLSWRWIANGEGAERLQGVFLDVTITTK